MMNNLFNSTFENSLRILLLLNEYELPQTLDMIYVIDFMALYGASLGITDHNLNGDNDYKFSVFASHRECVKEALKELVLNGTAQAVSYKGELSYIVTPDGEDFSASLESDYASEYKRNVQAVLKATHGKTERSLISAVNKLSAKSIREEAAQ